MSKLLQRLAAPFTLLVALVASPAHAVDEADLLPVDEAFALTVTATARDRIELTWQIADGYYLYRERIAVSAVEPAYANGTLSLPPGKEKHDEFFGDVQIYRGEATAIFTGVPTADLATVTLRVKSQGCADAGVCYPPNAKQVTVDLPAPTDAAGGLTLGGAPIASPPIASSTSSSPLSSATGASLGGNSPFGGAGDAGAVDEAPLPPEQAFVFEAIPMAPDLVLARFTPAKGYYLYRDKTKFSLARADDGVALASPAWPQGVEHKDEHFGDVIVYFDLVEVPIRVTRANDGAHALSLTAEFQGCQTDGICYPPMTRTVDVALPAGVASGAATAVADEGALGASLSEQDRLANALAGPNKLATLLAFFGFGVLLAFTPCVFPMVPILSGIIAGAGDIGARRAFVLSFVYVLASAVVFTIAGVVAGLAGQNLQAAFQNPWVLSAFALVFVALAFSMFGYYELQLPAAVQTRLASMSNRQQSGSLVGVAIMGALSALIVGPCVAPPLAAAVIYIAEQRDPWLGGLALFSLAMGMGAPLLAFGTGAGRFLPRAGGWMDAVKRVFGVLFLLLAVWMLERFLAPVWIMLMVAAIAVGSAVFLRALDRLPDDASSSRRLGKALGVLLLALGIAELAGALSGAKDPYRPLGAFGGSAAAHTELAFTPIKSTDDLDAALASAKQTGTPVLLDFYADWCVACKEMEKYTFPDAAVQQGFGRYVRLKADVTANDDIDQALMQRFGIIGPPATLFFPQADAEQRNLRLVGFEEAAAFAQRLERGAAAR